MGMAAALASGLLTGAFYGMSAVFGKSVGFSDAGVASFMATAILGGAALQWPVGHFSDSHDRRVVLLWVCVLGAREAPWGIFWPKMRWTRCRWRCCLAD